MRVLVPETIETVVQTLDGGVPPIRIPRRAPRKNCRHERRQPMVMLRVPQHPSGETKLQGLVLRAQIAVDSSVAAEGRSERVQDCLIETPDFDQQLRGTFMFDMGSLRQPSRIDSLTTC